MSDKVAQECAEVVGDPEGFHKTEVNLAQRYLELWEEHGKLQKEYFVVRQESEYWRMEASDAREKHDILADELAEMENMTLHLDYCVLPGNHDGECQDLETVKRETLGMEWSVA